jgi:hypothetical protein
MRPFFLIKGTGLTVDENSYAHKNYLNVFTTKLPHLRLAQRARRHTTAAAHPEVRIYLPFQLPTLPSTLNYFTI